MADRLHHRPPHRLRTGAEFDRVYREGRRVGDALFAVNVLPNDRGTARLGMSVGLKTTGSAVRRNRVRRVIRETFRYARPQLPAADFVVTSRPGARDAARDEVVASLERLFELAVRKLSQPAPPRRDDREKP